MAFNSRFIRNIILVAADQGADPIFLSEPVGMSLSEMNRPDQPVHFEAYNQLMKRVVEQTQNPHIGISVSQQLHLSTAGLVLQLMQSSATIREGLEQVCAFYQLGCSSLPMSLEGNTLLVQHHPLWRAHSELAYQQTLEGAISFLLKAFNTLSHGQLHLKQLELDYDWKDQRFLESTFHCALKKGPEVRLEFQAGDLDQSIHTADQELLQNLVDFAQRKLEKRNKPIHWSEKVNHLLLQHLPESLSQEQVAGMLALSVRSLQRNLKQEGSQFRNLAEQNKMEFARIHLESKGGSVKELSFALGYSQTSAFSRAFKRHFGRSPADYLSVID